MPISKANGTRKFMDNQSKKVSRYLTEKDHVSSWNDKLIFFMETKVYLTAPLSPLVGTNSKLIFVFDLNFIV